MASEHHLRPAATGSTLFDVTPASAGWSYLSFSVVRLGPGETHTRAGDDREVAVVPLEGSATLRIGSLTEQVERSSVFTQMPRVGYAPPGVDVADALTTLGISPMEFLVEARRPKASSLPRSSIPPR